MLALETPQAHANLRHTLSDHLMPPDRAQSQSQASMMSDISDILNAYSEPRQDSSYLPRIEEPSGSGINSRQQQPALHPLGLDRPNESPGFSDHSAASASTTPPPQSPKTPDSSPPKAAKTLANKSLIHSPTRTARSYRKTRATQSEGVSGERDWSSLDKGDDWIDSTRDARLQHLHRTATGDHRIHSLKHKHEVNGLRRLSGEHEKSHAGSNAEWDSTHMRNVTIRKTRKQHQKSHSRSDSIPITGDDTRRPSSGRYDPGTPSHLKHEIAESDPRELHQRNISTSSSLPQKTPKSPETEMNRWSSSSKSSAVVKATVIFPEQRTPKLRHVSKNESLRSGASAQSNRNSWASETPTSPLISSNEKRKRISTDTNSSSQSPPHILRRRADFESRKSTALEETRDIFSRDIEQGEPPRVVADDNPASTGFQVVQPKRMRHPQLPLESPGSLRSNLTGSPDVFHDAASHVTHQPSFESLHDRSHVQADAGSEQAQQTPRPSVDFLTRSPDTLRRVSFDPALSHSELSDRYARFSPMSARSEATEAFEVGEANTLDIYPHSHAIHGSVVKVDVPLSKPTTLERQEQIERQAGMKVIDGPFTPSHRRTDSPWKHPREAPQPPTDVSTPPLVAIHPPTPAREVNAQDEAADASGHPIRRTSLLQRARRYSDTLIQPIGGSLRRKRRNNQLDSSSSNRHPGVSGERTNLHPFWKPKGQHWNDISNTEDEVTDEAAINDWNSNFPIESRDSRPATAQGPTWRRGGSLRGFLLGNTLGLERGPANNRRPRITLPSQARATQSAPPSSYQYVSVRDSARQSRTSERPERAGETYNKSRRDSSLTRFWKGLHGRWERDDEKVAEARREELRHNIKMVPNTDEDSS